MKSRLAKSSIAILLAGFASVAFAGSGDAQESVNNLVGAIGEGYLPPNLNQDTQAAQAALRSLLRSRRNRSGIDGGDCRMNPRRLRLKTRSRTHPARLRCFARRMSR